MGVEPTGARCSRPPTDFEDRGAHRDTSTPTESEQTKHTPPGAWGQAARHILTRCGKTTTLTPDLRHETATGTVCV
jgi:hypothetical protein